MKLSMKVAATTALAAAALATLSLGTGCGKSSKSEGTTTTSAAVVTTAMKGSCNLRTQASTCSEETAGSDPMGLAKGLCDALKGTWSEAACPKENAVGSCLDKDGSTTFYYADGEAPRDLDDAKASCETINEGKFTALAAPKPAATATAATPTPAPKPAGKSGSAKPAKK